MNDFDQETSFEPYDYLNQSCEPQEVKAIIVPPVYKPQPSKIQDRYRTLKLRHLLHDFPSNHYKYLPKFDGEIANLSAENHIEAFENFTYLF
jgi:hypothetical protein